eukprot:364224-Chlamydomonas_euryale.AAC.9
MSLHAKNVHAKNIVAPGPSGGADTPHDLPDHGLQRQRYASPPRMPLRSDLPSQEHKAIVHVAPPPRTTQSTLPTARVDCAARWAPARRAAAGGGRELPHGQGLTRGQSSSCADVRGDVRLFREARRGGRSAWGGGGTGRYCGARGVSGVTRHGRGGAAAAPRSAAASWKCGREAADAARASARRLTNVSPPGGRRGRRGVARPRTPSAARADRAALVIAVVVRGGGERGTGGGMRFAGSAHEAYDL